MITRISTVGILVIGLVTNSPAAIVYELVFSIPGQGNLADTTLDTTANQLFSDVQILLRETVTGPDASLLEASNLNNGGLTITASGADGRFQSLNADLTGVQAAPSNSDPSTIAFFGFFPPGKTSSVAGGGVREVVLGTVDLVAPTAGQTSFKLQDLNPSADGDFTTFAVNGLEGRAAASAGGGFFNRSLTLSVTAVPEPGFALLSFCALGLVMRRRRSTTAQ